METLYRVIADIWFHQDSDPGVGPEPYGWIKYFDPNDLVKEKKIWEKSRTNESFTYKQVTFEFLTSRDFTTLGFYGDVKDWDTNSDDILAYPDRKNLGKPGEKIRLNGDRYDTYIEILYRVENLSSRNSHHKICNKHELQDIYFLVENLENKIGFLQELVHKSK
ncbi:hypothetical protein OCE56_24690 [Bacillus cereus]|nr:hypothetical protein [Bacillus cereus]